MSTSITRLLSLLFMVSACVQACKTDLPGETPEPYSGPVVVSDAMKALTNNSTKKWRLSSRTFNKVNQVIPTCEKDDRWIFNTNGEMIVTHGTNRCFVNEPAADTLAWSFSGPNTYILLDGISYKLYQLTGSSFITEYTNAQNQTTHTSYVPAP